jgi:hypothetical protein
MSFNTAPQHIVLTRELSDEPMREPDVYVNTETGAFGTEAVAMADGGAWQGFWRV